MNRFEFINELKNRLNKLPYDEIKNAIDYYEEYFDEAGPEKEQEVISELGSPAKISSQIIANYAIKDSNHQGITAKKSFSTLWIVILGIFASPIALPLAIAVVMVLFAVLISMFSVYLAIGVSAIAVLASGLGTMIVSVPVMFTSPATGIFFFGVGLIGLAVGASMLIGIIFLTKVSVKGIAKGISRFLLRRTKK